jgi:hypothetical protein
MKPILLFVFSLLYSVTVCAGVKTFPLNSPQEEGLVFACKDQTASHLIAKLSSENRLDELNIIGPQLVSQGICAFGGGTIVYLKQTFRVETEHGLFTVYEAKAEGVSFPLYIPMKDWEHSSI